jgi:hypothetical protein
VRVLFFLRSAKKSGGMTRRWTHYLPALIAAAVLVACAAAVLAVSREAEATFPGKNGKIAYVAFRLTNGAAEIYTINPGRGGKTQITHSYNTTEFSPSYSPDGKKIAYTGYKGNAEELYTIDVVGIGKTSLTNTDNVDVYMPSWRSRP